MALLSQFLHSASASWSTLLAEIVLLAVLAFVINGFRAWYPLRAFKGPFLANFSDLWIIRHVAGVSMHSDLFEITEKYGIVRFQGTPS